MSAKGAPHSDTYNTGVLSMAHGVIPASYGELDTPVRPSEHGEPSPRQLSESVADWGSENLVQSTFSAKGSLATPTYGASARKVIKRIQDIVLSVLCFIFLAPLIISIAIAIRIESSGPIIFRQRRFGLANQEFVIYKFRSMCHHHDSDSDVPQATRDDPRVSRVGKFLRRTSLDELPQLFNVLRGDMSLVGPRPHAVPHHRKYSQLIDDYAERHRVPPGITGWAQVNGFRGETETLEKMQQRVRYDLIYVENWSLRFDLRILLQTVHVMFHDHNAF